MEKETKGQDRFGNPYTIESDGENGYKVTQTHRDKSFEFIGKTYSFDLLSSELVMRKSYYEDYHHEAALKEDPYGRLFLYFYDEEMRFEGPDREDYLWVLVSDETDADRMAESYRLSRLRVPFIAADEGNWMAAHEYVGKETKNTVQE